MKIQGNNPLEGKDLLNKIQELNRNQNQVKKNEAKKEGEPVSDRISLSGRAKEIAELKKQIDELPEIRAEKVEAIKKAIESGTYKVDSLKVAQKIIEEEL